MLRGFGALWAKAYEFETIRQGVPEAASCLEDLSRVKAGLSYSTGALEPLPLPGIE